MTLFQSLFYQPGMAFAVGIVLLAAMWTTIVEAGLVFRCLMLSGPGAWLAYSLYETYMVYIWEPQVHGPIRLDLALLFPILCFLAALSLIAWGWLLWRPRS
jgi:hypothetical protein